MLLHMYILYNVYVDGQSPCQLKPQLPPRRTHTCTCTCRLNNPLASGNFKPGDLNGHGKIVTRASGFQAWAWSNDAIKDLLFSKLYLYEWIALSWTGSCTARCIHGYNYGQTHNRPAALLLTQQLTLWHWASCQNVLEWPGNLNTC